MDKMKIYHSLPIWCQNMLCNIEGKRIHKSRYGGDFEKIYKEYLERNSWSCDQKINYRNNKLSRMIKYAYNEIPYYKEIFDEYGVDPNKIKDIDDLKFLPILNKNIIKSNIEKFKPLNYKSKKIITLSSSGTTGSGIRINSSIETIYEQYATYWRARNNIGIKFNEWCAVFGGRNIISNKQDRPPFWRENLPGKQIYFSVYHLKEEYIESYLREIENRKIEWIHSYPSSLNIISDYMIRNNRPLKHPIKFITTGSENLSESHKNVIEKAFGVRPFQHYGQAENVAIFSELSDHRIFVDEDFSAVEFIYDDNYKNYKVVGTTLSNYAMPLIRYDIGDIVEFKETSEGREILSIDGRKEDYIVLPDGKRIGRLAHVFTEMENIIESQIIQKDIRNIHIKIVKNSRYNQQDERNLLNKLNEKLGASVKISIDYVGQIPRTNNGKVRFIVSELNKK